MKETAKGKKKRSLGQLLYHNSFVLACSFITALVAWFVMISASDVNYTIYDVPIEVNLSAEAQADGLRVFNTSYANVDIEVSGSSVITSKLTAEDFQVTASLNPASTKLTGNTMQKMTAAVRAIKRSSMTDYEIVSVKPEEINIEYDRFRETALPIEMNLNYKADTGYYPGTAVLSEERVVVSGPESAVNKISRVEVAYNAESPLRETVEATCPLRLFDQENQEITDTSGLYLSTDIDSVQVTMPVMPKKTVPLRVTTAHQPTGFPDNRIIIEPAEIDIAGSQETLDRISEIRLEEIIDFASLELSDRTSVFNMEIPIPAGARNITNTVSNSSTNTVATAKVTINLNGYRQAAVTVPEGNVQILNAPTAGGLEATLTTRTLEVNLLGPAAQVSKLTGDALMVQLDMTNVDAQAGSVDVPATVTLTGSAGEDCWVIGTYTMTVTMAPESVQANAQADSQRPRMNVASPAD